MLIIAAFIALTASSVPSFRFSERENERVMNLYIIIYPDWRKSDKDEKDE